MPSADQIWIPVGIDTLAITKRQHRAFALARLGLVIGFLILAAVLFAIGYPMPWGFQIVLAAEGFLIAGYYAVVPRVRHERPLARLHYAFLVCELVSHSAIVYFLGGLSWLGVIAYMFAIIYATIFLSWRQAAVFTVAVIASFLTVVTLDATGTLPHQYYLDQGPERYRDLGFLITTGTAFVGVIATVTFWMVFVGNEMRRERDQALQANVELVRVQGQLRALNEELERKVEERTEALLKRAETDQLTHLLNRGAITRRLKELLALAQRGGRPLAVILTDGDNFKQCNDRGGHPYGDTILQFVSRALIDRSRESDQIGRMGGDEFLIVLPDTDAFGAVRVCRRVMRYLERKREKAWEGLPVPTLSYGIAVYPDCGTSVDELIRAADQAMYAAKRSGGNCWRFSGDLPASPPDIQAVGQTNA